MNPETRTFNDYVFWKKFNTGSLPDAAARNKLKGKRLTNLAQTSSQQTIPLHPGLASVTHGRRTCKPLRLLTLEGPLRLCSPQGGALEWERRVRKANSGRIILDKCCLVVPSSLERIMMEVHIMEVHFMEGIMILMQVDMMEGMMMEGSTSSHCRSSTARVTRHMA